MRKETAGTVRVNISACSNVMLRYHLQHLIKFVVRRLHILLESYQIIMLINW